ncbi:Uncharacterised protein [marine metagenome]
MNLLASMKIIIMVYEIKQGNYKCCFTSRILMITGLVWRIGQMLVRNLRMALLSQLQKIMSRYLQLATIVGDTRRSGF